jgi:hydroxyethylthiazole kinase-like uncharacterized protein yjeF
LHLAGIGINVINMNPLSLAPLSLHLPGLNPPDLNPLYCVAQIRAIEQAAAQLLPAGTLMQRAGRAGANCALALLTEPGARVLLLVGPGNNGGDALEVAAHLADAGMQVSLWMAEDAGTPSAERSTALAKAMQSTSRQIADADIGLTDWDLIVDGLFGIGLQRPLTGRLREIALLANRLSEQQACPLLALDVPSGLEADTGAIIGADGVGGIAIRATHTLTFIGDKTGLHTCDGRDCAGAVQVASLDIDAHHFPSASAHLNSVAHFGRHLRARRHNTHKGSFGNVAVLGGAEGMTGAPILAARSALFGGAGRVYIAFPDTAPAFDSAQPELMCRQGGDIDVDGATLVAGPGLGNGASGHRLLARAVVSGSALLIDADGLNLLAADAPLQALLAQRSATTVLTPHPLEAARLLGIPASDVQANRIAAAGKLALQYGAVVVLKGSGSIIAAPDGRIVLNGTGNAALATAGTGDVLSGLCGALLAQGWPAWDAALGAVWLHGKAADDLVAAGIGPIGLSAGELIPAIRLALNDVIKQMSQQIGKRDRQAGSSSQ